MILKPLTEDLLPEAAGLLAQRHRAHRAAEPLLPVRFWPRQGFRPVVYRLSRRIDPRIAWAR
jgi:hypothetical protein